jgi:hypothetical protein
MWQGGSYVQVSELMILMYIRNTRRYDHPLFGVPGLSGWGYAELRLNGGLGSSLHEELVGAGTEQGGRDVVEEQGHGVSGVAAREMVCGG